MNEFKDPYLKKVIKFSHRDVELKFAVSQQLFSSHVVDRGTQRLLRTLLFEEIDSYTKVLDVGCGYGPIGVSLAKQRAAATVHMTDIDALALRYARTNAQLNGVEEQVTVFPSVGFQSVQDNDYDLILSNIPAKVGSAAIRHFLLAGAQHLSHEGKMVIVVVDSINPQVSEPLESHGAIEVTYHRSWTGHHVYHYRFTDQAHRAETELIHENDHYDIAAFARNQREFFYKKHDFELDTSYGLGEFDELSYDTSLLLSYLKHLPHRLRQIIVLNPGQGYVALTLAAIYPHTQLLLVDRNLLALGTTLHNLKQNGLLDQKVDAAHVVGLDVVAEPTFKKPVEVVVGVIPDKQDLAVYGELLSQLDAVLKPNGCALLASSSTVITRIEDLLQDYPQFSVQRRKRDSHRSVVQLLRSNS